MRNIILIVIDTQRADHLGCYGYERPTTPFLDRLARRSLVFDALWSASNFTAPAFTSLFTAAYPTSHGIVDFFTQAGGSAAKACLDAAGYRSFGVVTFRFFQNLLRHAWGEMEAVTDTRSFDYAKDLPTAVSDGAIEWLERHGRQGPFALLLHYDGPHLPYRLPDAYANLFDRGDGTDVSPALREIFFPQAKERIGGADRSDPTIRNMNRVLRRINHRRNALDRSSLEWIIDKYDNSVRYTDDQIARVWEALEGLDLVDDTVLAVISDHGEELQDHGQFGHGALHLYEEIIRTVGILHDPAGESGRCTVPLSHVNVLPSLLCAAGVRDVPPELRRLDLREAIRNERAGGPPRPVFCFGLGKAAVRLGGLKLIRPLPNPHLRPSRRLRQLLLNILVGEWRSEVYDLAADPGERRNLAGRRDLSRPLARALAAHLKDPGPVPGPLTPRGETAAGERERIEKELRDLGYM